MSITLESPLKIRRRIGALRSPALGEWVQGLRVGARESLQTLTSLQGTLPEQLVAFYQIVSPWCDRSAELYQLERKLARIDYGQYNKVRQALTALAAQDERCRNGVNRTSKGQRPSAETTFLGNRLGVWTHPVSLWERERARWATESAIIGQAHPTVMEVIDAQASTFLSQGIARWKPLFQALIDS